MRVATRGYQIFALRQNISLGIVCVVNGKLAFINRNTYGLRFVRSKLLRLCKPHKVHGGLLYAALDIVIIEGFLNVNLNRVLTRNSAYVLYRNRNGIVAVRILRNGVIGILELSIRAAVTEGMRNHFGIIEITRLFPARHVVEISGFGIAVTKVYSFLINDVTRVLFIGAFTRNGQIEVFRIFVAVIAEIIISGVVFVPEPKRIGKMSRRVNFARDYIADGVKARYTHATNPQSRVDRIRVVVNKFALNLVCRV